MKLTKKILLAVGLIAAAGASHAQIASTGAAPVGVLGQSYTKLGFGLQDIDDVSENAYSLSLSANAPVTPHLDLAGGYSYSWIRGNVRGHQNALLGGATAYTAFNGVKPFVAFTLGYQWSHFPGFRDSGGLWGGAVGVEIPVGAFSLTPRIVYNDDFEHSVDSTQSYTYEVEANYWVSRTAAVYGSIGKSDVLRSSFDSWNYELGLRLKF